MDSQQDRRIAIVGLALRLPGGCDTLDAFWAKVSAGEWVASSWIDKRWGRAWHGDPKFEHGVVNVDNAALLDRIDSFDQEFFGIPKEQATCIPPEYRMMLELAVDALDDAGMPMQSVAGTNLGVFCGVGLTDYLQMFDAGHEPENPGPFIHEAGLFMAPNRISYALDARGPSVVVDSACATSALAVHLACQSLHAGECQAALVTAAQLYYSPSSSASFSQLGTMSKDGRCRPFDETGRGYGRGEGVLAVVLKPLARARADGDRIHAVIRATATCHGGRNPKGFTQPRSEQQAVLIQQTLASAGVAHEDIDYFEAHGTGTVVGDFQELTALGSVFENRRTRPLPVGSVKACFNHGEAAAGLTGILKAVSIVQQRTVPPTPIVERPREDLDFSTLNIVLPKAAAPIAPRDRPVCVGVNSFGIGGSYVTSIIEEYREEPRPAEAAARPQLIPISVGHRTALDEYRQRLSGLAATTASLGDLAHTLSVRRTAREWRTFAVAATGAELVAQLANLPQLARRPAAAPQIGFVFTGMGPQWWGMGQDLLATEPVFAGAIRAFDAAWLATGGGWSVVAEMQCDAASSRIVEQERASVVNGAVQVALAYQLAHWGVRPSAIVGHSVGELAAAHIAGCLTLEQLAPLLKARASWTNMAEGLGTMLAVGASGDRLAEVLRDHPEVDVAARNSPAMTTIAGHRDALDKLRAALDRLEIFAQPLRVTVPYHSRVLRDRRAHFAPAPDLARTSPPNVPYFSATKGVRFDGPFDSAYWMDNVCDPVLFHDAVAQMTSVDVFLEIGPHPVLKSSIQESSGRTVTVLESLHREKPGSSTLLSAVGKLYQLGVEPAWSTLSATRTFVDVPSVPWRSQSIWREGRVAQLLRERKHVHPLLGKAAHGDGTTVYETHVSVRRFPFLREHLLNNTAVYPAALFITMIRRAAEDLFDTPRVEISNAQFLRPLFPDEDRPTVVRTTVTELDRTVAIQSAADPEASEWITHVIAEIGEAGDVREPDGIDAPSHPLEEIDTNAIYPMLPALRIDGHFVVLSNVWRCDGYCQASLADTGDQPDWFRDAMLVELAMQALWQTDPARYRGSLGLPAGFRKLTFCNPRVGRVMARAVRRDAGFQRTAIGDVVVSGSRFQPILILEGYERMVTGYGKQIPWRAADSLFGEQLARAKEPRSDAPRAVIVVDGPLARALERDGATCEVVATREDSLERVRRRSTEKLDVVLPIDAAAWDAGADLAQVCWATFDVLRKLARIVDEQDGSVRVFLAIDTANDSRAMPHHVLVALSRVFRNECPHLPVHVVQCAASALSAELRIEDAEREVVWTTGGRHALRVVRDTDLGAALVARDPKTFTYTLGPVERGRRELGWFEHVRRPLESRDVRVRVLHAALNFRDILKLDGGYPTDDGDAGALDLGDECMGIVLETGRDATHLREGQRVLVNARRALASEVVVDAGMAWPVPDGIDDVAAACIPAVFGTAWHALRDVANLQRGERILIHSGAGGVGLAAIQIATLCGAEIYATAGTAAKRELLRSLGAHRVYDSKSLHFKDDIERDTAGELVDVVLNSLAGPALIASMKLLRPFGRFVEIGRRDLYANTHVGIHPLRNNVSFVTVDMGEVWRHRAPRARAMMTEVLAAFAAKQLVPLPVQSFEVERVGEAFAALGDRERTGKVCVQVATPTTQSARPGHTRGYRVSREGTYLVTGGFGAIGSAVLRWLAKAGATSVAVVSRSGSRHPEFAGLQRDLAGVTLHVYEGSVADEAVLKAAIDEAAASGRPVRGVIHLAGTLRDRAVDDLTRKDFQEVLASKISGAWNLHRLLGRQRLDCFVMFSSISVLHGTPGQSAYVMANAFMDWLASHRRQLGLAAQALGWGPFLGGGMAVDEVVQRLFEHQGFAGVTDAETRELLDTWIPVELPHVYVRRGDWQRFLDGLPAVPPLYEKMASGQAGETGETIHDKLRGTAADERRPILVEYLVATISAAIGRDLSGIQDAQWLGDNVGIDSLATIGLTTRLSYELGVRTSQRDLARGTTFGELVERLLQRLGAMFARKDGGPETPAPRAGKSASTRIPLLPAQTRWLPWMINPDGFSRLACGVPTYFELPPSIDDEQIETIVHQLVSRHEALRARFQHDGSGWIQSLRKHADVMIHRRTAQPGQNPLDAAGGLILEPWNVTTEPLLRCALVTNTEDKSRALVLSVNHLVCDHLGLNPLLGDVRVMLHQLTRGHDLLLPEIETNYAAWCELVHDKMATASRELPDDWRAVWAAGKAPLGAARYADGTTQMRAKPTLAAFVHAATKVIDHQLGEIVAMVNLITVGRPREIDIANTIGMMTVETRFHLAESIPLDLDFDDCIRRFCVDDALEPDARAAIRSRTFQINAYAAPHDPKDARLFDDTHDFLFRADQKVRNRLSADAPAEHPYAAAADLLLTPTGFRWFLHSYIPGLTDRAAALFAAIESELQD